MTTKTSALALSRAYPAMNYLGAPRVAFYPGEEGSGTAPAEIPVQTSSPEPLVVATDDQHGGNEPTAEAAAEAAETKDGEEPADGASDNGDGTKKPAKVPEWLQKKMAADAFEARETARKLKAAEEELAKLKAPKPATPTAADTAAAEENAPAGGYRTQADFDAAVQAEAQRRQQEAAAAEARQAFDAACNAAYAKGKETFKDDFDTAVANLQQLGAMNPEMLDLVLGTDDPAKLLFSLGSDPDKAADLMALPPAKRAIEIAKLSVAAPEKGKPTPLSNAPRPIDTVEGSARPNGAPRDDDDDATWFAKRNAEVAARQRQSAA